MYVLPVILPIFFTCAAAGGKIHWGYEGHSGPENWHKLFDNACSGRYQSPIDIRREMTVYDPDIPDFALWHDPPKAGSKFDVLNNGHTVQVNTVGPFYVANGGLPSVYSTVQFHFHWGHRNHHGSEHLVDGQASPLELHVVSYDSEKYDMISKAMTQPQGLAVLGVLFRVVKEDNPHLEPIIQAFQSVRDPEVHVEARIEAQPIRHFLPKDTSKFYRYNGSLTTPGCFESVIWTVFHEKQTLSHRQMNEFRNLLQPREMKHKGKGKRDLKRKQEKAAEEVLDEVGIRGDLMEELTLAEEMKKKQMKEANKQSSTIIKEYEMATGKNVTRPSQDEGYKIQSNDGHSTDQQGGLEDIPVEFIQEALWNNFRPVQPLNERLVYRTFTYEPRKEIRYVVGSQDSPDHNLSSNLVPSVIVVLACYIFTIFSQK